MGIHCQQDQQEAHLPPGHGAQEKKPAIVFFAWVPTIGGVFTGRLQGQPHPAQKTATMRVLKGTSVRSLLEGLSKPRASWMRLASFGVLARARAIDLTTFFGGLAREELRGFHKQAKGEVSSGGGLSSCCNPGHLCRVGPTC